jgi:hypothetical protein
MKRENRVKEIIKIEVLTKDENEHILEIEMDGDVLTFTLDSNFVFSGDYSGNFAKMFKRALEVWGPPREDE